MVTKSAGTAIVVAQGIERGNASAEKRRRLRRERQVYPAQPASKLKPVICSLAQWMKSPRPHCSKRLS